MQGIMHERVRDVIADVFRMAPTKITDQSDLSQDLQADSLDFIELSIQLEEAFGIEIQAEDLQYFSTVRQIVEYLEWKVKGETGSLRHLQTITWILACGIVGRRVASNAPPRPGLTLTFRPPNPAWTCQTRCPCRQWRQGYGVKRAFGQNESRWRITLLARGEAFNSCHPCHERPSQREHSLQLHHVLHASSSEKSLWHHFLCNHPA